MDAFDLRERLVDDHQSYTRSFIKIRDPHIIEHVEVVTHERVCEAARTPGRVTVQQEAAGATTVPHRSRR